MIIIATASKAPITPPAIAPPELPPLLSPGSAYIKTTINHSCTYMMLTSQPYPTRKIMQ